MAIQLGILLVASACLALAGPHAAAQATAPGDTLSLAEVYALAHAGNPMLAATLSRAEAVLNMESAASLPPDPQFQVGVMNASRPVVETNMPSSMAPSIQLMQMVPIPGKPRPGRGIAKAETAIARAEAEETAWMVRARAAMAFFEIYQADREVETMRRTLRLLEDSERIARAVFASGGDRQTDVLRAGVEIDREAAGRYGLNVDDIQMVLSSAVGGMTLRQTVEGRERYGVRLRYPHELRDQPEKLAEVLIPVGAGRGSAGEASGTGMAAMSTASGAAGVPFRSRSGRSRASARSAG